ncbi:MAG TPA: hypothetical protein VNZ26_21310 [Vicinamibacterales bacterium]|jgi:hypothetical protein|nr:hypothetical protein [Vicinamibacterales bacterium]
MELGHEFRLIPLDGRPRPDESVRQWNGLSRGRWEGDVLVVETSNYSVKTDFLGSSDHLHVIERFTRVGPKTIQYEISVNDPTTWTKSWTVMIPLKRTEDKIYEYACHEGNVALPGILRGQRVLEQAGRVPSTAK